MIVQVYEGVFGLAIIMDWWVLSRNEPKGMWVEGIIDVFEMLLRRFANIEHPWAPFQDDKMHVHLMEKHNCIYDEVRNAIIVDMWSYYFLLCINFCEHKWFTLMSTLNLEILRLNFENIIILRLYYANWSIMSSIMNSMSLHFLSEHQ